MLIDTDKHGIYWLRKGADEWKGVRWGGRCYCTACLRYDLRRWMKRLGR